ncbi:MAG: hypothetical protein V2I31_03775 [Mariniphaga sp.]|jgi:hypothetical protein|nr:hypothetical protein [Mariniphaga sp.]
MKKTVKLILALLVLVSGVFLLGSCAKDEDPGEYFMRFKANGTLVEYTNQLGLAASFAQSGNQHVSTISGWNDASSNFSLLLYNLAPIAESTYSGYSVSVDGTVGVLFAHKEKESEAVFSSGVTPDYDARITISELTETGVKGTFSGLIKAAGYPDISITEGAFFVKRVLN